MANTTGQLTQEQLKIAAAASLKKILPNIETLEKYVKKGALKLSSDVVPEDIDVDFVAVRELLESCTKSYKAAKAAYTEYAENIELTEQEDQSKPCRLRL